MSYFTKTKLKEAVAEAERFGDEIDARGKPPTQADMRGLQERLQAVKAARVEHERSEADGLEVREKVRADIAKAQSFMSALSGYGPTYGGPTYGDGPKGFLRIDGGAVKAALAGQDIKALGTLVFPTQISMQPLAAGMPATSLLDIIPANTLTGGARTFNYLRQTTRTNNAAPVAPGGTKPTSVYTLTPQSGEIRPIAHLSEPINTYDLADNPSIVEFLHNELRYGLALAVTNQVLNGTGVAPQIEGINTVAGTQSQAFVTDRILTARAAITKLETNGLNGEAFVLHPTDWEAIETAKATSGEFLLDASGAPIDRVERRLWGVRVVLDMAVPAGTGWLIAQDTLVLQTDGQIRIEWATAADDFTKNLIRARCEGRFGLQVNRPLGLVELDLTA